jgi:hypothetical protein
MRLEKAAHRRPHRPEDPATTLETRTHPLRVEVELQVMSALHQVDGLLAGLRRVIALHVYQLLTLAPKRQIEADPEVRPRSG